MLNTWLISAVLLLAGAALFTGRHNWRLRWDRVLILSVVLQALGFLLAAPFNQDILSRWSYSLTGAWSLPDFIGHMCFIGSLCALIDAIGFRLIPNPGRLRDRVEKPSAFAATLMLASFTLAHPHCVDFFTCPVDNGWLRVYWVIAGVLAAYLMFVLIAMLLAIRREYPESRLIVDIYLVACLIGSVAVGGIAAHGLVSVSPLWIWVPLCLSSGLSFIAGSLTWTRNRV